MSRSFTAGALAALAIILFAGCTSQTQPKSTRTVITEFEGSAIDGQALSVRVPDVADGLSGTNPPGTVEVYSTANLQADTGRTRCTGDDTLWAPVTVKNYATEQLVNVAVQFTDVTPLVNKVCNSWPSGGTPPLPLELLPSMGLVSYGDIAGSAVSTGGAAGGATSQEWWFNWSSKTSFAFKAKVWATITPAPPSNPSPAAGSTLLTTTPPTLTWTGPTPDAFVQVATDAAFTNVIRSADLTSASGSAPYSFSYISGTPVAGTVYYWRAVNVFTQPGGSSPVRGTFSTGGSYQVGPTSLSPADGSFTAAPATMALQATVPDSWPGAVFTVCTGAPPCTTALHTSGAITKSGSTVAWTTPSLDAGRYTWRVTSSGAQAGYAESGFYMDAAPTNLHSEYVFAYNHRFYADSFAPWVDFYWYSDDPGFTGNTYTTRANAHLDPTRIVGPPTFTAVDFPGVHYLYWFACTQYRATSNYDSGNKATQGACTADQLYTYP